MQVVLFQPEIAPNTGNVVRLCACTNTTLHLIEPLGFKLDDASLKRAGLDYWAWVRIHRWPNWATFAKNLPSNARLWMVECGGPKAYDQVQYQIDDYLVFGRETAGLPPQLLEQYRDTWIYIPILNPHARSLNLANCVAIVLYEALRQLKFPTYHH